MERPRSHDQPHTSVVDACIGQDRIVVWQIIEFRCLSRFYAPLTRTVRCADRVLSGWIRNNVEEIRRASCRPWAGQLVQGVKAR